MLCINTDTSLAKELLLTLNDFLDNCNMTPDTFITERHIEENLDVPIDSFADSIIQKVISESGIHPARMTRDEKMEIVKKLNEQGIPRMKGAIATIAEHLNISESTVYRYINQK